MEAGEGSGTCNHTCELSPPALLLLDGCGPVMLAWGSEPCKTLLVPGVVSSGGVSRAAACIGFAGGHLHPFVCLSPCFQSF